MLLGGEAFLYKLLFNKACNDGQNASIDELRKNLAGDRYLSTDLADDLLEYLDSELPKASSDDTERVMEDAAPILAALLVPLKREYDRISQIKDEVTEAITEVIPVDEMIEEYEVTLEDLRSFCRSLADEVDAHIDSELNDLHAKLWELDDNCDNYSNYSNYSYDNYSPRSSVDLSISLYPDTHSQRDSLDISPFDRARFVRDYSRRLSPSSVKLSENTPSQVLNESNIKSMCHIMLGSEGSEEEEEEGRESDKIFEQSCEFHDLPLLIQPDICPCWSRSSTPHLFLSARNSRRSSFSTEIIHRHLNKGQDKTQFLSEDWKDCYVRGDEIKRKRNNSLTVLIDYVRDQLHGDSCDVTS